MSSDRVSYLVNAQVYETPFRRLQEDRAQPLLFSSLERRDSAGLTLVAKIRPDARFSDGTLVTPDHIIESLRASNRLGEDVRMSAAGEEIVFQMDRMRRHFERTLAQRGVAIVLEKDGQLLGTGPYLVDSISDDTIVLARNEHSPRRPRISRIEIRSFPPTNGRGSEALIQAIESGEVGFSLALSRDDVARVSKARKLFAPGWSTAILFLNTERPGLSDPTVRRGLAAAVDRYRLTEICYSNPSGFAARGLLPPRMGRITDGLQFDPNLAASARGKLPAQMSLLTVWGPRPYLPRPQAVARALDDQLRTVGTSLEIVPSHNAEEYRDQLCKGDYDLVLGGWIADEPDRINFIRSLLASNMIPISGRQTALTYNLARWSDPFVDEKLRDAARDAGAADVDGVLARVADQVPLVPLMYGPNVVVHAWNLRGFDADRDIIPDFARLEIT